MVLQWRQTPDVSQDGTYPERCKMSKPTIPAILCRAATVLSGCANDAGESPRVVSSEAQAMPNDLQSIVAAAKQDAVARGSARAGHHGSERAARDLA